MLLRARYCTGETVPDIRLDSAIQMARVRRQELPPPRLGHQLPILDDRRVPRCIVITGAPVTCRPS